MNGDALPNPMMSDGQYKRDRDGGDDRPYHERMADIYRASDRAKEETISRMRNEIAMLEHEKAALLKQADYAHRLICDWWKPQTTSQEVHRQYALSALANDQAQTRGASAPAITGDVRPRCL